ncbi:sterol desaturase family protein [Luteimonas gilva]|uniref:Sterol desaturase family protein n=2 Tax=Luteimonas gilva TaxID=2572684 RepID=A0A4U5JMT7_9GAMM|nr:sterol desaturase family protein [Luteimonas gilva]
MIAIECRRPGSALPRVPGFYARAALLNLVQAAIAWLATMTWDRWLPGLSLWRLALPTVPAALMGYVLITFVYYWWHRARHESRFLWRWLHQVHHSASRLEVATSFYKHPFEIAINGALSSALVYLVLGLDPAAATLAVTMTGLAELFYHWNVRTPHWLGYLIQRPESHRVHHQRGRHRMNYSDLPLWDLMFGTFHNPRTSPERCGFSGERERQLGRMLLGRTPL